jgi:hypothetical protein
LVDPTGLVVCAAVLAAASVFGLVRARRTGRLRERRQDGVLQLSPAELGQPLGERATLVQFSTAFCSACPGTRRFLADIAARTPE